jgi:alpha-tubulin suppressor-like RCC1 family protein
MVASGGTAALAQSSNPTHWGWGLNTSGQLGLGTSTTVSVPTPAYEIPFTQIVSGVRFGCGLTSEGAAYCWGENDVGQLGTGNTTPFLTPQPVVDGHTFISLSAGAAHVCGLTPTDSIFCWGDNSEGQLGIGNSTNQLRPALVPNSYTQVAAGTDNTCALNSSGIASCWGLGSYLGGPSAIGDGTLTSRNLPTAVVMPAGRTFQSIGVGRYSACALDTGGDVWCWGWNANGQLGTGNTTDQSVPTAVIGGVTFKSLSVGAAHRCGIATSGDTYCWGSNTNGQLGIGTTVNETSPQLLTGGPGFESVSAFFAHTCALDGAGIGYCWGENRRGQTGRGTQGISAQTQPLPVLGNQRFSQLARGSDAMEFTLALPLGEAFGEQVPTAPMQQFARDEADSCGAQPADLVDFPALGNVTNMSWGPSWAQWPNGGTGGFVCTRQPYYTNLGTWSVR